MVMKSKERKSKTKKCPDEKECLACIKEQAPANQKFLKDRLLMQPCPIGLKGMCCKNCLMGPCRVMSDKIRGICGASEDLIVSRNILRFTAGGTAAHCGHAHHLLTYLKKSYPQNYIKKKAPKYLYKLWDNLGILPKIRLEHFKDISEALHLSTMGVDADYKDVLGWCLKLGIIDGYYGLYLATELEDKEFGKPKIKEAELNLNVIKPDKVNIAVHGHEPIFAEALAHEVKKPENQDINLIGVCCTGASILARYGIPMAANFVLQEEVIATGMIEAMVVDVQCIMPSLSDLCECNHTHLITTNELCKMPNATHLPITNKAQAEKVAKLVIEIARRNKKFRKHNLKPLNGTPKKVVVGFTEHNFPIKPREIAKLIHNKKIKGVIAFVGCVNPRVNDQDKDSWISAIKTLSKNYIILTTGCIAFELGKQGLLDGKRIFHMGSCVNNSRVAEMFKKITEASSTFTYKKQMTNMPFLVSCPMPLSEKSLAIGMFFATLGVDVHFGYPFLVSSDTHITHFLEYLLRNKFKSKIFLETKPEVFLERVKEGL